MSHEQTTDPDSLSEKLDGLARVYCEQFLDQLRSGREPRIESFLADSGEAARPLILRQLLQAELEWRRARGEAINLPELRGRFPRDRPLVDEILGGDDATASMQNDGATRVELVQDADLNGTVGEPPGRVDRYEIRQYHAKGGLGIVSLAHDQELHRDVALKEIRPDSADNEQYRVRFIREAEVTARLEHPGIVPVYGIGYREDGRPYYIMRFIKGETLKAAILRLHQTASNKGTRIEAGEPQGTEQTLSMLVGRLIDVCHAVAYAHHRSILHRDIKPENIMLGPFGETLVVDWGLAKFLDGSQSGEHAPDGPIRPSSDSQESVTRAGSKIGTTGYMSPEQASGSSAGLAPTSDVYSLGATLYFLLTGRSPAEREQAGGSDRSGPKETNRKPSEIKTSVPPPLEAICLKAMALRPIDRYDSAKALAEDLERWRSGEPVEVYPEPWVDRFARWSRTHRTALSVSSVVLVTSTIGLIAFSVQMGFQKERIGRERDRTLVAEQQARHEARVAEDARAAAIEAQTAIGEDLRLSRKSLRQLMDALSGPQLSYLPNSGEPRLAMASGVLKLYSNLLVKHPDDSEVKYELALASRTTANIARSIGSRADAEPYYLRSIDLLKALLSESPNSDQYRVDLAQSTIDLGSLFAMSGQPKVSEARQLEALGILAQGPGTDRELIESFRRSEALARMDLAAARLEQSRFREALGEVEKSAALLKALTQEPGERLIDNIYYIHCLTNRAIALSEFGQHDDAGKVLDEAGLLARELRRDSTKDNPDLRFAEAVVTSRRAQLESSQEKHVEALATYEAACRQIIEIFQSNFRPPFLERELAVAWLGRAEERLALVGAQPDPVQFKQIQSDLARALNTLEQLARFWPEHYDYQSLLGANHAALGKVARINKQDELALKSLTRAHELFERACELNPEEQHCRELEARSREELKRLNLTQPAKIPGS